MIRLTPLATSLALHLGAVIAITSGGGGRMDGELARSDASVYAGSPVPAEPAAATPSCSGRVRLLPATSFFPVEPPPPLAGEHAVRLVCVHIDSAGRVDAAFPLPGQVPIDPSRLRAFASDLRFHAGARPVWMAVVFRGSIASAPMA